jgi:serine/threonine protein kinase/lipopolysaccharide biosynthesis regulator YciM
MAEEDLHDLRTIGGPQADESAQEFPVKSWDRYKFVSFIGQGGMGRVFKAFDPTLKRFVALKFIRGDDPIVRKRFLQEAQSQARIEHENVCKVYEAGEVERKFYIAMQYIDGVTLGEASRQLTLEQKIKIFRQVAEGLHAAHRNGLIHRDIKPGNIMVEKTEDELRPYVMDFGLVREISGRAVTMTGVLVGTPHYMAPEQAWGDVEQLDRRVDIYSLGATMYESLTGTLPLDSQSTMEVLKKLTDEEPKPLREISSNIPADLETIVLKCLEKEPARRYGSARALAEDLQRYMDGEPILARRTSFSYRMIKKARKHRALVSVSIGALIVIASLAAFAIRSQIQSRERALLAQRFGQQVVKIESLMRLSHISPLHDVRPEKNAVRKQMKDIETQMADLGEVAKASGHYAVGRGYLSLKEYEKAKEHLEKSWNDGYQNPESAYALGLTLSSIYQKLSDQADSIRVKEERDLKFKELQKEYGNPAINFLKQSKNSQEAASDYVEGLIALHQLRYDQALKLAHQSIRKVPWLYEAKLLEGKIYSKMGTDKRERGDYAEAFEDYDQAIRAINAALKTGESDPAAYQALCDVYHAKIFVEVFQTGRDIQHFGKESEDACGKALQADPEYVDAYFQLSRIYGLWSRFKQERGQDPEHEYSRAIEMARAGLKIQPDDRSYDVLTSALRFRAEYELYNGIDPRPALNEAISSGKKAVTMNPKNGSVYGSMGQVYMLLGEYEMGHGKDPRSSLNLAVTNFQESVKRKENQYGNYNSLANTYAYQGDYEYSRGIDPTESWKNAIAAFHKALEINSNYTHAFNNIGTVHEGIGKYQLATGQDPTASFLEAENHYQKTITLNPSYQHPYINLGITLRYFAEYEMSQGHDPSKILKRAEESNQKGIEISKDIIDDCARAEIHLLEAKYDFLKNRSPETSLSETRTFVESARKNDPSHSPLYSISGSAYLIQAKWQSYQRKSFDEIIRLAEKELKKAVELNSLDPGPLVTLAECQLMRSDIDAGLKSIEKALNLNSNLAEAYAIQGLLLLNKDKQAGEQAIRKALSLNKNLTYLYAKYLGHSERS